MKSAKVKLADVCQFIRGVTFDKAEATTKPEVGKLPILRAGNIGEELDAQNDLLWVPESRITNDQRLRRNDIAICMSSGSSEVVGKTARVPVNLRASVGSFCGIIRPRITEQASYLSFYFRSPAFAKQRDAIARGANIQNLRFSSFEEIEIEIPNEQQRIAGLLEQADRLRRTRRYALELSDTFLPAAFLELFGDPVSNTMSWESASLVEVCVEDNGIKAGPFGSSLKKEFYSKSGIRIYGQEQVIAGDFNIGDYYISDEMFSDFTAYEVRFGDLLISLVGSFGKVMVVPEGIERGIINPRLLKISPKPECILPVFVAKLIEHPRVQDELLRMSHGGTMGILNASLLRALRVVVPPLILQQKFVSLVESHERLRSIQREALRQAEHLFQTLLHRAFSEGV